MQGEVTKHFFAEKQHRHEMNFIVSHSHKRNFKLTVNTLSWPSMDAHLCNTPAALSRAYLEDPVGHLRSLEKLCCYCINQ